MAKAAEALYLTSKVAPALTRVTKPKVVCLKARAIRLSDLRAREALMSVVGQSRTLGLRNSARFVQML